MFADLGVHALDLYTLHAPGVGRVLNVIGSRREVLERLRDRRANGEAFDGERLSRVRLALRFDGAAVSALDLNSRVL